MSEITPQENARSLIIEARTSLYWRGSLVQRLADALQAACDEGEQ